jgi:GMP synthase (glutamine-hydrolysing)
MKILVVDNAEPEDAAYTRPLIDNLSKFADVETLHYFQVPPVDELMERYDGIVLSGAPVHYSFDIMETRLEHIQWIKTIDLPVLGVCLGHQTIGRLYGAQIMMNDEMENSLQPLLIATAHDLLQDVTDGDTVAAFHRGSITLPEGFTLLASTLGCQNHAMKHNERDIFSVQFHAEHSDAGITVLRNFTDIVRHKTSSPRKAASHPAAAKTSITLTLGV